LADPPVIRLFRFRPVRPAFDHILRTVLIPDLAAQSGLLEVLVGRRGADELDDRVVVSIWSSRERMVEVLGESFEPTSPFHPELLAETTDRTLEIASIEFADRGPDQPRPTILRVSHGRVSAGRRPVYIAAARDGTAADIAAGRGPAVLYLSTIGDDEFVTVSAWTAWAELAAATGGDVAQPIATRHPELIVEFTADHFELLPLGEPRPAREGNAIQLVAESGPG
jgi:hypothetical protein